MRTASSEVISRAPGKTSICAVVVTFRPDPSFCARLLRIASQVGCVLVVVNSASEPESHQLLEIAASDPRIHLLQNSCNVGVATALNQGASWAAAREYSWLFLLDQDTEVDEHIIDCLAEIYSACPLKDRVAVIGSNYHEVYSDTYLVPLNGADLPLWKEKTTVITSGSLLSLDAFRRSAPFETSSLLTVLTWSTVSGQGPPATM